MRYRYLFVICLLTLMPLFGTAQENEYFASLSGKTGTSLFTGRLSYTIPLYTIEDPDFHLDIALCYGSDGFKPFQPAESCGQDWSLVAGGCITRSVQGLADEQKIEYVNGIMDHFKQVGMIQAMKDGENTSRDSVFNFTTSLYKKWCGIQYFQSDYICYEQNTPYESGYCEWDRDYMPDIYTFSFCGYKGKFIVNNVGNPVIISGDFVKINISDFRVLDNENYFHNSYYMPSDSSKIKIYTTDGYTYVFGGSRESMEYSFFVTKNNTVDQPVPVITAWHLTEITAPNGRKLLFNHSKGIPQNNIPNSLYSFITDYDWTEKTSYDDSTHIIHSLHKSCLLQSINTSDSVPLTVCFYSSQASQKKYNYDIFTNCKNHSQLDSIIVTHNNTVLRKAYLNYQYRSNDMVRPVYGSPNYGSYWRYLRQVTISGVGRYTMQYNNFEFHSSPVNNPWAYYQFKYPSLYVMHDENYKEMVDRMSFWRSSSLQGMLSEVSLPTGGKVKFTYGAHQYGEERRFRAVGTKNVELYTQSNANQTIGGARIEKIETFSDDSTLVETKTFSYNKQGTNNSSGIYYNIYNVYYPDTVLPVVNPYNYSMMDSHIGYSYVEQHTTIGTDSYKTAYTFYTGRNSYSSLNNSLIHRNDSVENYNDTTEVCSGSLTCDGWFIAPGKLLRTEQYNGNTLAKSIQFEYNGVKESAFGPQAFSANSLRCTDTIVCLSKYSAHVARKLFVCPDVVEKTITREYDAGGQYMETVQNMTYDKKLRKKEVRTTDSRGIPQFVKFTYPDDLHASFPYPIFQLCRTHRIGRPIETISGYTDNDMDYVTGGEIELYSNNAYSFHGANHFVPYLSSKLSLSLSEPISDYQPFDLSNHEVPIDPRYQRVCSYHFDLKNRLISIKPYGEMETRYVWDGLYPISKTTGNQTYTYTYKPYVGITSVTNPRGITTYYSYDAVGRLVEEYVIENGQKQILNAYHYHTKTE